MKVLLLSAYPPLSSFTAAHGYWLAHYLKDAGVEVCVVSDGWDSNPHQRCWIESNDFHSLTSNNPKFFSLDPLQSYDLGDRDRERHPRLVSLALDVFQRYGFDLIYTNLLPRYATAAYTVKQITGKPLVVTHHPPDFEQIIYDSYLETYTHHILQNADLVLGYPEKFSLFNRIGVEKYQEMMPLGITLGSERTEFSPEKKPMSDQGKKFDPNLPSVLITGDVDYAPHVRQAAYRLGLIEGEINLLLACNGEKLSNFKKALADTSLAERTFDLGALAPWQMVNLFKESTLVISTPLIRISAKYDPALTYQLMSLGIPPVLTEFLLKNSSSSFLNLNSSNYVYIDHNIEDVFSKLLKNSKQIAKLGKNAQAEYQKIDQNLLLNILKGVK